MATRTLLARGEAVYSDVKRRTAGNLTINTTSWIDLDTALDITLTAAVGDKIDVAVNCLWADENTHGYLDVATLVSGSPVTYFSSGSGTQATDGMPGWIGLATRFIPVGGPALLPLVSGDIAAGQVTLRLRTKTLAAVPKVLLATTGDPLHFTARNLGPG